nr:MAG TPA: hypothetical protein [Caudoviricetes sp.]
MLSRTFIKSSPQLYESILLTLYVIVNRKINIIVIFITNTVI